MANKVVQITFSDSEYEHLERKSAEDGLSIALYIKNKVLDDTEFKKWFKELLEKVERIQPNTEFNIKMVFATDWAGIERGVKLALGRAFFNYISAGKIPDVQAKPDKDSSNVQWYIKN